MECPVCLQLCVHPSKLPCGHIFCFLCVKVNATSFGIVSLKCVCVLKLCLRLLLIWCNYKISSTKPTTSQIRCFCSLPSVDGEKYVWYWFDLNLNLNLNLIFYFMVRVWKIAVVLCAELNFPMNFLSARNCCCQSIRHRQPATPNKMNINGFTKDITVCITQSHRLLFESNWNHLFWWK